MTEPRVALVSPWPPPEGGMAVQARGLRDALVAAGTPVEVVPTNVGLGPLGRIRGVRGVVNLAIFLARLVWTVPRVDVVHVLSASGLTFFLFTAPTVVLARVAGRRLVVNYRGGLAESFLARRGRSAGWFLRRAHRLVVPSGFLEAIFRRHGHAPEIVPNYIDVERFGPRRPADEGPRLLVTRNLEPIYNVGAAIDALAIVRERVADATLWIAGTGSERQALADRAQRLGVADAVHFLGRVPNDEIPMRYATASIALNPTDVDNMPISVLEAFAAGVPVVSTRAGGVPWVVEDGVDGLLVDVGDAAGLAAACLRVLEDPALAERLVDAGRRRVDGFRVERVVEAWQALYRSETRA